MPNAKDVVMGSFTLEDGKLDNFQQIAELVEKKEYSRLEEVKKMLIRDFIAGIDSDPFMVLATLLVKREDEKEQAHLRAFKKVFLDDAGIQEGISKSENKGAFSDGYHTFDELYEFRKVYNAALFNEWAAHKSTAVGYGQALFNTPKYNVHKSMRHYTGEECFGGGWFIVVAVLPTGQISNHYEMKDWDLFKIPIEPTALFPFDEHTSQDVIERLKSL
jgi:hypothetical protein